MAKEPSFDFGFNVKVRKPKVVTKKQSKSTKMAFALAKKKGGELYGRSGS
jgi:hypothetical protein